jgi:hypothetical protein
MRLLVTAGLMTAAAIPLAGVAEAAPDCQVDDTRRAAHVRIEGGAAGGSAPASNAPAQTSTPRETAAEQAVQREDAEPARTVAADRRRSGKRIPDAELIGPRGAL